MLLSLLTTESIPPRIGQTTHDRPKSPPSSSHELGFSLSFSSTTPSPLVSPPPPPPPPSWVGGVPSIVKPAGPSPKLSEPPFIPQPAVLLSSRKFLRPAGKLLLLLLFSS